MRDLAYMRFVQPSVDWTTILEEDPIAGGAMC